MAVHSAAAAPARLSHRGTGINQISYILLISPTLKVFFLFFFFKKTVLVDAASENK